MADPAGPVAGRRGGEAPPRPAHGGNIRQLARLAGVDPGRLLDFSASINPLGPPDCLRPAVSAAISGVVHYPDPESEEFVAALAARLGLDPGWIVAGNGSTELIHALVGAFASRRVTLCAPSYVGYREAARAAGVEVALVPLREENGFALDWRDLDGVVRPGDLVFLGHPNNPTGVLLDRERLRACAAAHPRTMFAVDEAFIDFVPGADSALTLIGGHPNIVVLRSLTKFYAMPGLRLGFAVAAPGATAWNPVFDVTPAALVDAIVTEKGVVTAPDTAKLAALMAR